MLVQIKALVVVFTVSALALLLFFKPISGLIGGRQYLRWAALWLGVAAAVFLVPQYWLFVLALSVLLLVFAHRSEDRPAAFMLLAAAIPAVGLSIPGFLGINRFISTQPQTFLIIVLLLPLLFAAKHMKKTSTAARTTDFFFLCWLLLQVALALRAPSITHMVRLCVEAFLAFAPIYYVFSRHPKSLEGIRSLTAAFVLAAIILSLVTIPETLMNWHYYTTAASQWVDQGFSYKFRSGALRATGSSANPIVWGFIAMCGLGLAFSTLNERISPMFKLAGFGALIIGLLASLSRGPWIGALCILIVFTMTAQKKIGRLLLLGLGGVLATGVAAMTPSGQRVLGLLPFIGDDAGGTIGYRQQLLDASLAVIAERPIFGTHDYLEDPRLEAMRQGEGIIDIVNSYIQVALQSGVVGLFIYLGILLSALAGLRGAIRSANRYDHQLALYCRAYFATLVGVMLTLFTTSTVEQMPYILWALIGGAVGLTRVERMRREDAQKPLEPETGAEKMQVSRPEFNWK